jgi:Tfp pilus assembly protein FimT
MVVVVLIGVMTAMIVPEMKGTFEEALLHATGRQLISACNLAYSQAVSGSRLHQLRLDLKNGRYELERASSEPDQASRFVPLRNVPGAEGPLDKRIHIEVQGPEDQAAASQTEPGESDQDAEQREAAADPNTIAFYPDGTAAKKEILLRDREGFRLVLRINPTTARVRIVDLGRQ